MDKKTDITKSQKLIAKKTLISTKVTRKKETSKGSEDLSPELSNEGLNQEVLNSIEEQDRLQNDGSIKKATITTLKAIGAVDSIKESKNAFNNTSNNTSKENLDLNQTRTNSLAIKNLPKEESALKDETAKSPESKERKSFLDNEDFSIAKLKQVPLDKKKLSTTPLAVLLPKRGDVFEIANFADSLQGRQTELKQRMIDRDSEAGKDLYAEEIMLSQVLDWLNKK